MNYWNDMREKYGFNDGASIPAEAFALRSVYVKVMNAMLETRGSNVRVREYNRPGVHNCCMIVVVPNDGTKWEPDVPVVGVEPPLDSIAVDCFVEAAGMDLDGFVTVVVTVDDDAVEDFIVNNFGEDDGASDGYVPPSGNAYLGDLTAEG